MVVMLAPVSRLARLAASLSLLALIQPGRSEQSNCAICPDSDYHYTCNECIPTPDQCSISCTGCGDGFGQYVHSALNISQQGGTCRVSNCRGQLTCTDKKCEIAEGGCLDLMHTPSYGPGDGDELQPVGQAIPCSERDWRSSVPEVTLGDPGAYIQKIEDDAGRIGSISVSEAGPQQALCCPRGSHVTEWIIAYTHHLGYVGSLSARCSDPRGTEIPTLSYGYYNTSLQNCSGDLLSPQYAIDKGTYSYRIGHALEELISPRQPIYDRGMTWLQDGFKHKKHHFGCSEGQVAGGFSGHSSCISLADVKVVCVVLEDRETLSSPPHTAEEPVISTANSAAPDSPDLSWVVYVVASCAVIALVIGLIIREPIPIDQGGKGEQVYNPVPDDYLVPDSISSPDDKALPLLPLAVGNHLRPQDLSTISIQRGLAGLNFVPIGRILIPQGSLATLASMPNFSEDWLLNHSDLKLCVENGQLVVLGSGGFGTVLKGRFFNITVAIKLVPSGTEEQISEFVNESKNLAQSKFPCIVEFFGICCFQDKLAIIMEYLNGQSVYERIRRRDKSIQWKQRGRSIMINIANGLYYLHSKGMAHNDLKSPNVLLTNLGVAKIGDFALGKLVPDMQADHTGPHIYSKPWSAPECRLGRFGLASDIWALGTIWFEICKLQRPPSSDFEIPPLPGIIVPDEASQAVVDMIARCREFDPAKRPRIGEICEWLNKSQG